VWNAPFVETSIWSVRGISEGRWERTYLRRLSQRLAKSASWIMNHGPSSLTRSSDQFSSPSLTISSVSERAVVRWSSRWTMSSRRSSMVFPCSRRSITR
jgi:hypothetical protein